MSWQDPQTHPDRTGASIVLRTATEADAEAILAHVIACDSESPYLSREPGEFSATPDEERLLIRRYIEADNALFMLAVDQDALIGTLTYTGWRFRRMHHTGRFGMSVRKSHWHRGIGGLMLDSLIAWAQGNGITRKIGLEVQETNERAIALYLSRGFTVEGRLRREMRIDDRWVDLLLMGRWLDGSPATPDAGS